MSKKDNLPTKLVKDFIFALGVAAFMIVAHLATQLLSKTIPGVDLVDFGIQTSSVIGALGVITAPFVHGDLTHLMSNLPLLVVLGFFLRAQRFYIPLFIYGAIAGGVGTWLIVNIGGLLGGNVHTSHIGASGVVFAFIGFFLARFIFSRRLIDFAIALGIVIYYGGIGFMTATLFSGMTPGQTGISWQWHLCGFLAGVHFASWPKNREKSKLTK